MYENALASNPDCGTAKKQEAFYPEKYAATLLFRTLKLKLLIEPGRFISGNAGILFPAWST